MLLQQSFLLLIERSFHHKRLVVSRIRHCAHVLHQACGCRSAASKQRILARVRPHVLLWRRHHRMIVAHECRLNRVHQAFFLDQCCEACALVLYARAWRRTEGFKDAVVADYALAELFPRLCRNVELHSLIALYSHRLEPAEEEDFLTVDVEAVAAAWAWHSTLLLNFVPPVNLQVVPPHVVECIVGRCQATEQEQAVQFLG